MKSILYAIGIFLFLVNSGFSAEIPKFDIEKHCKEEHVSNMAIGSCIKFEKEIKQKLLNTGYPVEAVSFCTGKIIRHERPSYFHLYQCIQLRTDMQPEATY